MKKTFEIKVRFKLCDRNRNFGEITSSIKEAMRSRDGVDDFCVLEESLK